MELYLHYDYSIIKLCVHVGKTRRECGEMQAAAFRVAAYGWIF